MLLFTVALSVVLLTAFLLHCDDLFLDLYASFRRLKPRALSSPEIRRIRLLPQRRLALLLPYWKEADLVQRLVSENLGRIEYGNFSVFLGVYPNDYESWAAARRLETRFANVSVIVNDRSGPTSKAQLLNEMVRQVLASEEETGLRHEGFVFHDAEDVIHPLSFALLNRELESADLVQLPVLSLPLPWRAFTAGTYADESAEAYTKHLLARAELGARLPNGGVGTALSRTLMKSLLSRGLFLDEKIAAESYHLGLAAGKLGFRARALSAYREGEAGRDFIATKKFFPDRTEAAIRQKARWTAGVAFQGASRLGHSLADTYFLWRDRRGPWTTLFLALASCLFLVSAFQSEGQPPLLPRWLEVLSLVNAGLWLRRAAWRVRATAWVHGWSYALLAPLRWPVANFLNSISTWRALALYGKALRTGEAPPPVERPRRAPAEASWTPSRPRLERAPWRARNV